MLPPSTNQDYLGTVFIVCAFLSSILAGCSIIQGYLYFRNFQKDQLYLKSLIGAIWLLDGVHISLIIASLHNAFVTHFNDPSFFQSTFPNASLTFDVAFVVGTVSMGLVLAFHSYRVKIVTSSRILRYMCFFVTATRNVALFLLAVLSCVAVAKRNDQEHSLFLQGWTGPLLLATVALSTLSDVNGTILVSASLWKHRKDNVTPTRHSMTKIILYTVQTGAARTIFMLSLLFSTIFAPINISWMVLAIIGPHLYTNSLLMTLNARVNLCLRARHLNAPTSEESGVYYISGGDIESGVQLDRSMGRSLSTKGASRGAVPLQLRVEVESSTECDAVKPSAKSPGLNATSIISLSGSTAPPVSSIDRNLRQGQSNELPGLSTRDEAV
ncbi:hypothetical protein BDV98DRAFT_658141 [Pterulicium gracile]|uniref:DUF6534 domain-containing protein n=1 Tax=Pterulicium gracile TaxID=1884261 RepID=A0A5C3Q902_9AGAR|nr:hypothetical protein BDV98DRAFT_658141 [Pterula gracilis]